jgi:hypothetical protein
MRYIKDGRDAGNCQDSDSYWHNLPTEIRAIIYKILSFPTTPIIREGVNKSTIL